MEFNALTPKIPKFTTEPLDYFYKNGKIHNL
jgi:hypothetical protein